MFASLVIGGYALILWTDNYKGLRKTKWLNYYVTEHGTSWITNPQVTQYYWESERKGYLRLVQHFQKFSNM
jgi:hypothetical protein